MTSYPWQLEDLSFSHQEVRANPAHDPKQDQKGSPFHIEANELTINDRKNAIAVQVSIKVDETHDSNAAYFVVLTAFAVLLTDQEMTEQLRHQGLSTGLNILIGAMRERLATLTARGPWGVSLLGPIPMAMVKPSAPTAP